MSDMNPYQPPKSGAGNAASAAAGNFIAGGRAVEAGQGWEWIVSGFALFKKQPVTWILMLIALLVCSILIAVVPIIGGLANMLLMQVFIGGAMIGCRALDRGEELEVGHVFAGFKQNTSNLVVLGLLALVAWMIVLIPALLILGGGGFMAAMHGGGLAAFAALGLTFVLVMLVVLALAVPIYMALWFAPALIVFHNLAPAEAMKTSFAACLKNIVPFLLYSVILLLLGMVAAIPFGLGFLVLVPVIIASIYTAYRDIFLAA
jgi:uncharacterized membrane protein